MGHAPNSLKITSDAHSSDKRGNIFGLKLVTCESLVYENTGLDNHTDSLITSITLFSYLKNADASCSPE
jgi:hypothetical protein